MLKIRLTEEFAAALKAIRDNRAVAKITSRIDRLAGGNPGDASPIGEGVSEMRIDYGPGYRVYYVQRGPEVAIILLCGDKSTQRSDIDRAKTLAKRVE